MRWLCLLVIVACGAPAKRPEQPPQILAGDNTCWNECYAGCLAPRFARSETPPCLQICNQACSCNSFTDPCKCAWQRALYAKQPMPAYCLEAAPKLELELDPWKPRPDREAAPPPER